MSLKKYASPLQLDLFSSRVLFFWILVFHVCAFTVLFFIALPIVVLGVLASIILLSSINALRLHAMRKARKSIVRVIWEDNGRWYIVRRSGEKVRVQFQGDSFVSPWLTVLNFKVPDKWFSQSVILASDNINRDSHRRLRVRLKTSPEELFD